MAKKGEILKSATQDYSVIERIGGGGAGEVYSVCDETGKLFAAKVLQTGLGNRKLSRFKNELMFCLREDHLNIIKVLDFGRTKSDAPFYVMPLASSTLRQIIETRPAPEQILRIFAGMLDGVEAAHLKNVVHRDLKPENVLAFSESDNICIADFGIAHFSEDQLHTLVETAKGERLANFEYAAPEQRRQAAQVDLRADISSLGLMLSELFTGDVPHGAGSIRIGEQAPDFNYLDDVVDKMRQQDPERRFSSIREIKLELLARRTKFIELQKLNQLRKTIVRESDVEDPLVVDPPTLTNVQFDGRALNFTLSRRPNSSWIQTFQNAPLGGLLGYGPAHHTFQSSIATIRSDAHLAQQLITQFKFYLQQVNELYARNVREAEKKRISAERSQLAARIQEEERIAAINNRLNW